MLDPMLGTGGQDLEGDVASCFLAAYILRDKGLTQHSKMILTPINTKCEKVSKRDHTPGLKKPLSPGQTTWLVTRTLQISTVAVIPCLYFPLSMSSTA